MKKAAFIFLLIAAISAVLAAQGDEYDVFIFCNPKTPVNVRKTPKKGEIVGRLDFGDAVRTDGRKKSGWLHVIGIGEYGEGWICAGYAVDDQPEEVKVGAVVSASGRVMTYKRPGGQRNGWLKVGESVKIYALSEEWAVTNKGYIRTKYLDIYQK